MCVPQLARTRKIEVKCYGTILGAYREHPEAEFLGNDGKPYDSLTRGLLRKCHIVATLFTRSSSCDALSRWINSIRQHTAMSYYVRLHYLHHSADASRYRVHVSRFVRHWECLRVPKATRRTIGHEQSTSRMPRPGPF